MKIEEKSKMRKLKITVLVFIACTIIFTLFVAVKAKGMPMIAGYDEALALPSVSVTYSKKPNLMATFKVASVSKIVHAGPGTVFPDGGEDKQSFEENFQIMIVFGEKEIPKESWLYIVKPNFDSPEIFVQLTNVDKKIYANGMGETFATAMDDLRANFEADEVATTPSIGVKRKSIEI